MVFGEEVISQVKHLKEKPLVVNSADTRKRNILSPWEQDDHIFLLCNPFFSKRTFMFISVSMGQNLTSIFTNFTRKKTEQRRENHEKYSIGKD